MLQSISRYTPPQALKASNNKREGAKITSSPSGDDITQFLKVCVPDFDDKLQLPTFAKVVEELAKTTNPTLHNGIEGLAKYSGDIPRTDSTYLDLKFPKHNIKDVRLDHTNLPETLEKLTDLNELLEF